jgi:hypothetical protein
MHKRAFPAQNQATAACILIRVKLIVRTPAPVPLTIAANPVISFEWMDFRLTKGNNVYSTLHPDTSGGACFSLAVARTKQLEAIQLYFVANCLTIVSFIPHSNGLFRLNL